MIETEEQVSTQTLEGFVRSLAELADMADEAGMLEKADRIAAAIPTVRMLKVGSSKHVEIVAVLEDIRKAATESGNERMAAKADQLLKEAQLWDKIKDWYGKGKDWLGRGKDWLGRQLGLGKDKPVQPPTAPAAPLPDEVPLVDEDAEAPGEAPEVLPGPEPIPEPLPTEPEAVGEIPPPPKPKDPGEEFQEVKTTPSELDLLNKSLGVRDKIIKAINAMEGGKKKYLLRIKYTTLKGTRSERDVEPDYVWSAMTGNQILVAWDHLRWDWRGFILNRIGDALLKANEAEGTRKE